MTKLVEQREVVLYDAYAMGDYCDMHPLLPFLSYFLKLNTPSSELQTLKLNLGIPRAGLTKARPLKC